MEKSDLREYGDEELSLVVMNDEDMYHMARRIHSRRVMHDTMSEYFLFTKEQFEDLMETVEADQAEDAN